MEPKELLVIKKELQRALDFCNANEDMRGESLFEKNELFKDFANDIAVMGMRVICVDGDISSEEEGALNSFLGVLGAQINIPDRNEMIRKMQGKHIPPPKSFTMFHRRAGIKMGNASSEEEKEAIVKDELIFFEDLLCKCAEYMYSVVCVKGGVTEEEKKAIRHTIKMFSFDIKRKYGKLPKVNERVNDIIGFI